MALTADRDEALTLNAGNAVAFTTDFAVTPPAAPSLLATPPNSWIPVGAVDTTGITEAFAATTVNVMAIGVLTPFRVLYTDQTKTFQIVMLETERDICQSLMFETPLASLARVPATPPTLTSATGSTSGGTLLANTYYYKITGTANGGETTGSNEVSATTTGSTSSVSLAWPALPAGTTGIKVYRGTAAGAENLMIQALSSPASPFVDTGYAGVTATVPTVSTGGVRTVVESSVPVPDRRAWLFRIADGPVTQQFYVPQGEITTRANVAYPQNAIAMFDITLTTYPDAAGNTCYRTDNSPVTPLQSNS